MAELTITCPSCGTVNMLVAEGLSGVERVHCSQCNDELGRMDELDNSTGETPEAAD